MEERGWFPGMSQLVFKQRESGQIGHEGLGKLTSARPAAQANFPHYLLSMIQLISWLDCAARVELEGVRTSATGWTKILPASPQTNVNISQR